NLTLGTFAYADLPLRIEVPISGFDQELLRVIDADNNDCQRADEFDVECNTSSVAAATEIDLEIYPNPASELIYVRTKVILSGEYRFINMSGQAVVGGKLTSNRAISVQNLASGFYILRIELHSGQWISKKVLIH
ncbi:MAG: T9SS type A sorting domain-containing protein, partial [Bacteroidetes bacterium]|nr:T9SS type A sorting domain-containing protein [Bacteroidota bacterium]